MIGTSLLFSGSIGGLISPFDTIAPTAGYSLRALTLSYTGAVVRVRRDGDGAEQDFTAGQITNGTLSDFLETLGTDAHSQSVSTQFEDLSDVSLICDCNSGGTDELDAFDALYENGFVSKWYDQFGSNDAEQTTAAEQPKIWDSVTGLVTENGKPAISFNGVDEYFSVPNSKAAFKFLHDGTTATTFSTMRIGDGSAVSDVNYFIFGNTASASDIGAALYYDDRSVVPRSDSLVGQIFRGVSGAVCRSDVDDIFLPNTQSLVYSLFDGDNATASERFRGAVNGDADSGNNTQTNAPSTANATNDLQIGRFLTGGGSTGGYLLGNMQEIIFYDTDQSANRTAIESNINNYYDIY